MFYNVHRSGNFFSKGGGSLKACSDTLKYAKIWCRKTTSTEAAEVARGEDGTKCHRSGNFGTCSTMFIGWVTFCFEGEGVGGSLKVCSDTLKYAKIGCRKTTSAEAAEVARGEGGTKCDLWYLFYNVHRSGNFFRREGGLSKHAQIH